jgi:hypothetical protein
MWGRKTIALAAAVAALTVSACESDVVAPGGEGVRSLGILEYWGELAVSEANRGTADTSEAGVVRPAEALEFPATVQAGVPFVVRATTIGDGCTEADGAEVQRTGNIAVITAYDIRHGEVCTMIAKFLTREVTVQFDTPGTATIRLVGRRVDNGQSLPGEVVVEEEVRVE